MESIGYALHGDAETFVLIYGKMSKTACLLMEGKSAHNCPQHPLPVILLRFCQSIAGQNLQKRRDDFASLLLQCRVLPFGKGHNHPIQLAMLPRKSAVGFCQGKQRRILRFARNCLIFQPNKL